MGRGTYVFQPFATVPPSVLIEPVSALRRKSVRATCHPPRLPAAALRQECVLRRVPAEATTSAISSIGAAAMPDSFSAKGDVYGSEHVPRKRLHCRTYRAARTSAPPSPGTTPPHAAR